MIANESPSTRPYLIRALHEWCTDNGFTPYVAVMVGEGVQVPREFVKDGEIVLNTSYDATSNLRIGNDFIEFKARFGGVARDIVVPVGRVMAIYARENGQGMAFPVSDAEPPAAPAQKPSQPEALEDKVVQLVSHESPASEPPEPPKPGGSPSAGGKRPALKRVK